MSSFTRVIGMSASALLAAGSQSLMADQAAPAATSANDLTEVVVLGSRPIAE
jgi:hypothetical protein